MTPRTARRILQLGALLVVLAVVPGPLFDLDRFQVPKELVLHVTAFAAVVIVLRASRGLSLGIADCLLVTFAVLGAVSAVAAPNGWLGFRAMGLSWAAVACFWSGRAVADAGLARPLVATLAAATVLGALAALAQAYGVALPLVSGLRAPGGTLGNRNFMAHLAAIGLPLILYLVLTARTWRGAAIGSVGMLISSAALLLSRTRAAWVAVAVGLVFLTVAGAWISGLWRRPAIRARLALLAGAMLVGIGAALWLPNGLAWRSDNPYLDSLMGVANFKEGSGRGRLVQWKNTLRMAGDHPILGAGPGNWQVYYPLYTSPGDPAFDYGDPIPTNPWPSSDWVAVLAERGIPATLCLGGALVALLVVGWKRGRKHGAEPEGMAGLAMVALVLVAAVAGFFDAVLLLAAPTLIFWTAIGALRPTPRRLLALPSGASAGLGWAALGAGVLLTARSALTVLAIMVAGNGTSRRALVWASRLDPGDYRLHMTLATLPGIRGRCDVVREHAGDAHDLFPFHEAPRQALRACGVRVERLPRRR